VSRRARLADFLRNWITVLIPALVAVLIGASALSEADYSVYDRRFAVSWTLIAAAAALAVVEAALVARRQLRVAALVANCAELERRAIGAERGILTVMRAELIALQERAHLFSGERVSLFRCDGDHFTLVARRSPRPTFDQSLGRGRYPLDQGILGRAWAEGKAGESSLPSPGDEQGPPRRRWIDAQGRLGVPEEVAGAFTMRSQAYAAFRIANQERSFGVVVFESTTAVREAATAGPSPTKRTVAELEPVFRGSAGRLAALLGASSVISAARVRELLGEQQGSASRQS